LLKVSHRSAFAISRNHIYHNQPGGDPEDRRRR
jgi:hypothetical protein